MRIGVNLRNSKQGGIPKHMPPIRSVPFTKALLKKYPNVSIFCHIFCLFYLFAHQSRRNHRRFNRVDTKTDFFNNAFTNKKSYKPTHIQEYLLIHQKKKCADSTQRLKPADYVCDYYDISRLYFGCRVPNVWQRYRARNAILFKGVVPVSIGNGYYFFIYSLPLSFSTCKRLSNLKS